ncbi:MAG: hydroxyethylthiazole kinase [Thermovirgaceae bacterium]
MIRLPDARKVWERIRKERPLVYQLTSAVAAPFQAEVTAAVGAALVMSFHPGEARVIASGADALLLNTGMPKETSKGAFLEALRGLQKGTPCLLDAVGYGLTPFRTGWVDSLLKDGRVTAVKGNEAEMARLGGGSGSMKGVESSGAREVEKALKEITKGERIPLVAVATGKVDKIACGGSLWKIHGGSGLLSQVPASGCALGSVMVACMAVADPLPAAVTALLAFRIAAEDAGNAPWPASWKNAFVDALAALEPEKLSSGMKEHVEGPLSLEVLP